MQASKKLTLAIETAIDGGSLSIFDGQTEIDFWIGKDGISKAEDILENISRLFKANEITGENIEQIIISSDVGSATGLKIGMATAKGLAKSFSCRLVVTSLIDSLAHDISTDKVDRYVIALPVGKNNVFHQNMTDGNRTGIGLISKTEEFFDGKLNFEEVLYAHQRIIETKPVFGCGTTKFISIGKNMAKAICHKRV
jgi:tRNA A37 threonylcarbamoyladenosine modification protein TsaB